MSGYYNRAGEPITPKEWCHLMGDDAYHRVAFGQVTYGGHQLDVSTVWLGIDHNHSFWGRRELFETMVFGECDFDQDCARYATEGEALEGHRRTMNDLAEGRPPWFL